MTAAISRTRYDLLVVGSGFAGSILAMIGQRLGLSVLLVEKEHHPRFVIGESSTPLANLLLEEIAERYQLPRLAAFSKWGTWTSLHPEIRCGLKRGFTFIPHRRGRSERGRPFMVAASPNDRIADTHWLRSDLDAYLFGEARELGVECLEGADIRFLERVSGNWRVEGVCEGRPFKCEVGFVVDASGPRGFLQRQLGLGTKAWRSLPETSTLFSHFVGVRRWEPGAGLESESMPYPLDDAAVHHVLEDGWIWVLRFAHGVTSAGVAMRREGAERFGLHRGEVGWKAVLEAYPSVAELFREATPTEPFRYWPQLSFCSERAVGEGWAMLPFAAGFVDPLLSTGFPLTLLGVLRLAEVLGKNLGTVGLPGALEQYEHTLFRELLAAEDLISALYASMDDFEVFKRLSLLYFAAASFTETARRLGRSELARGFLLREDPTFYPHFASVCELARRLAFDRVAGKGVDPTQRVGLLEAVRAAISPIDIAGLCRLDRRDRYPVDLEDLYGARDKVKATRAEIDAMLRRCGALQ